MAGMKKKQKGGESRQEQGMTEQAKTCKCGSTTHQRPTHRECSLRKICTQVTAMPIQPP
jgi:hypothetical protein